MMKDFLAELAKRVRRNTTAYENYRRIFVPEGQLPECEPRPGTRGSIARSQRPLQAHPGHAHRRQRSHRRDRGLVVQLLEAQAATRMRVRAGARGGGRAGCGRPSWAPRAAELEDRLRQAAAESQAWCGLARSHEAVAAGLCVTLDHLLLCSGGVGAGGCNGGAAASPVEGCGESDPAAAAVDDAQSCCFGAPADTAWKLRRR
ncbi:hypothetical protein EJB05_56219, partial [Eragrostis curvula]